MFGFIKNLISGILSFIGGLFGKKNEYYLELKEETEETKPAPTSVASVSVAGAKVEPVKVESVKVESVKAPTPKAEPTKPAVATETNFATKYLMTPSFGPRRRPGANMNGFLDMARQVKVPG